MSDVAPGSTSPAHNKDMDNMTLAANGPTLEYGEDGNAIRGVVFGALFSLPIWGVIAGAIYLFTR